MTLRRLGCPTRDGTGGVVEEVSDLGYLGADVTFSIGYD